ncbi:hypothetical protein MKW94_014334 [Papaver nudicaule]|uniref:Cytochrome P450 n=1 Tax=Papaver nudicaule TaxID=74823 RepID=A0AA41RRX8_PAPNU|nr:hypothetical protein [Papaver nudicaule]
MVSLNMMIFINTWSSATVLFVITSAVVSLTHYWYKWSHPKCNGKLPPGSMGFPIIGETIQFFIPIRGLDINIFAKKRLSKYGKIFRTSVAGQRVVVSADQDFNYHIIQQEGKFVQLWYMDAFSAIFREHIDDLNKANIHKYMKRTMANYVGLESLKEKLVGRLEVMVNQGLRSWSTKSSAEVKSSSAEMIFNFALKEFCNYDVSKNDKNMSKKFTFMQAIMRIPLNIPGTAFYKLMQNQKAALESVKDMVHARIKSRENEDNTRYEHQRKSMDLLDQLVDDLKTSGEEFITESFVVVFLFSTLLASFEPVSEVLTLTMVLLTEHPLVVKELREEHEKLLKNRENDGSSLTWTEYKSMSFTHQVINESLRMANIIPGLLRRVIKDINVNGYVIPEGWTLVCLPSCVHMDPEIYENPLEFNPWRWDCKPPTIKNFLPFGGGIRNCVGADYTRVMIAVFLHVLVTKFR